MIGVGDFIAAIGLIAVTAGALVTSSVELHPRFWINEPHLPFSGLRDWRVGRNTLVQKGQISEDDRGFDVIKSAVQKGKRTQQDFTALTRDGNPIAADVAMSKWEVNGQLKDFASRDAVDEWTISYAEDLVRATGMRFIAVGAILQFVAICL